MKQPLANSKDTRQTEPALPRQRSAGSHAAALAPPAYGIEFADRGLAYGREPAPDGTTIPTDVRSRMEEAFGEDFSHVRLHEGSLARSVGALAATRGADIHFAPGLYAPRSPRGQQLLAHELAHVVQQASGRVSATGQRAGIGVNTDRGLEREADDVAAKAALGERVRLPSRSARTNGDVFRQGIRDFQDGYPVDSIRQRQSRVLGEREPVQTSDASAVIQCYGSVDYEPNNWPATAPATKPTTLSNDFGTFKVDHGLQEAPTGTKNGEYKIEIEMTPTKKAQGSTIRFMQAVRRGTAPGSWATKGTDPGMDAERGRRAAEGGWRVDRANPGMDQTPFYGHKIDGGGSLVPSGTTAKAGSFGGTKPYLRDEPAVVDPGVLEFSADAMDETTGASFGKVAWGFLYNSATRTYKEETPRLLPESTNWFLNIVSEDRRRVAGERAGREKWNEVFGTRGTGTMAGDANVKKVPGI